MIQIHNPAAVVFIEVVLILTLLLAANRFTDNRLLARLRYGFWSRSRWRRLAWLLVPPLAAIWLSDDAGAGTPLLRAFAIALLVIGIMMGLAAAALLRRERLQRRKAEDRYRQLIARHKSSGHSDAAFTVPTCILALNRSGVTRIDLDGCRLPGIDLRQTKLYRAALRNARLAGADLRGVGLTQARLNGAQLSGADLRDTFFYGADLRGADLSQADLRRADLRDADLRGACLDGCRLAHARLDDALLEGATFRGARMADTRFSVDQLVKARTLERAALNPRLRARLIDAQSLPNGFPSPPTLRLDGIFTVFE